ncbi:TROVE domain-containing protein [Gordonia bronchialis]|uniref:TROVE domain-containing protein n=1 Tax=Gordonia bronchialis TaxID=2054 RepID=UPI001CC1A117|nr:TROVE domain-containing protein [Gordonia bronchialis]UAK38399.1 TROVE domain-containing protein [Gordonia bronchialis]
MGRFNTSTAAPKGRSAIVTEERPSGLTFEGGAGYARDAKSELFLSAVTSFTDSTFYESENERLIRQRALVAKVAVEDPRWVRDFLRWLRDDARIRTASLILAAEAVRARLDAKAPDPTDVDSDTPRGINRQIIDVVLQRADEPGEMLAYWTSRFGRSIPMPVRRGINDAIGRLYNQKSLLKYDGQSKGYRFGDVIELTHPSPVFSNQGNIFRYAIDRRHNRENISLEGLETIQKRELLTSLAPEVITRMAEQGELADALAGAGMTWEAVPNLVNGPWTAKLWEAIIPSMGLFALLRNLAGFDRAGVSDEAAKLIAAKFADPEEVRKSRILPMRVLSAYQNAPNVRWAAPLEMALQNSLASIPSLSGNTLILVDRSGSMFGRVSGRSELNYADSAAIFGTALALRAEKATVVQFGSGWQEVEVPKGASVLRLLDRYTSLGGTNTLGAVRASLRPEHDRVVILTDEQYSGLFRASYSDSDVSKAVGDRPLHTIHLVGYRFGHAAGGPNRFTYSGLSDASWPLIPLSEAASSGVWPWQ